jgi:hypothetical protein
VSKQLQKWLGITGLIFFVLVAVSVLIVPNTPNTNASLTKLSSFYTHSKVGVLHIDAIITGVAVLVGVFWFWYFRDWLIATNAAARRLGTVAFAGALLFAAGGGLAGGMSTALGDAANTHATTAGTLQVLNTLSMDLTNTLTGAGLAIFLVATSVLILRYRVLPIWMAYWGILGALAGLVIGFFSMIGFGIWLIAASVVILMRSSHAPTAPDTTFPTLTGPLLPDPSAPLTDPRTTI